MAIKWRQFTNGGMTANVGPIEIDVFAPSDFCRYWHAYVSQFVTDGWCDTLGPNRLSCAKAKADAEEMACELARGTLAVGREMCEVCGLEEE